MTLKVGMKVHSRVGDGVITEIRRGLVTLTVDDPRKNDMALYHVAPVTVIEELNGLADLDLDAGHEEPWAPDYSGWGAERYLYSRQLQDANKKIYALEQENAKLREDLRKLMHAAAHPPVIGEEPTEFPVNALRFSV